MSDILGELQARGLLVQRSHAQELDDHLLESSRTVYCGFDPTAPSLHAGNLVPLLTLRRLQKAGHRPIILVGGATGLIGDPSGRDEERQLHDAEVVENWVERIKHQANRFVSFEGTCAAKVVNNLDWARQINLVEFLRDTGKHFSVNALLQRDAVKSRLDREGFGISYTEFSYALVQALDFLELYRKYNCTLQIGGQDQWGNMISGVDLIRRKDSGAAFVLTLPLVERSDGKKFGKSTGGAIWLDEDLTSPYAFYQFWLNSDDADVRNYLRFFTFLSLDEINEAMVELEAAPNRRSGQRLLAQQLTELVHGQAGLASAQRITAALFDGDTSTLTATDFGQLAMDGISSAAIEGPAPLADALTATGLAASKSKARQLIAQGGITANAEKVTSVDALLSAENALFDRYHLLRRGKKTWALVVQG